jgi:hypothetical protein
MIDTDNQLTRSTANLNLRLISDQQIISACYTFNHGFGLLPQTEQASMIRTARQWAEAFAKEGV